MEHSYTKLAICILLQSVAEQNPANITINHGCRRKDHVHIDNMGCKECERKFLARQAQNYVRSEALEAACLAFGFPTATVTRLRKLDPDTAHRLLLVELRRVAGRAGNFHNEVAA